MRLPRAITIREVAPRDGLQGESVHLSAGQKVDLINRISEAGFKRINAASFVSPKAVPQMADSGLVMESISREPGIAYDASVPNLKGAQLAVNAGADTVVTFVATSEIGSQRNQRCSVDEALEQAEEVIRYVRSVGKKTVGTIAMAFGSPYGEEVGDGDVMRLARRLVAAGASGISLGDTTGQGTPLQVARLSKLLLQEFEEVEISLHLHDTYGLGLANVLAAMDAGIVNFDAAIGGIGGSPFTLNASGNISTEDLVNMCHAMGIETGIDLEAVLDIYSSLENMLGHDLPGRLGKFHRA